MHLTGKLRTAAMGAAVLLAAAAAAVVPVAARRTAGDDSRGVVKVLTAFYTALAVHDWDQAAGMATAPMAARIRRALPAARPEGARPPDIQVQGITVSGDLAAAAVRVETQLAGGRWDVLWHRTELIRAGGKWLVARAEPVAPAPDGPPDRIPQDFSLAPLARYLDAVQRGDWKAAAEELAGPALVAHEAARAALGPEGAGLIRTHTPPQIEPLWADREGRTVVALARYQADGRNVSVRVTFFRTGGGWRVVDVLDVST